MSYPPNGRRDPPDPASQPPDQIGHYKILKTLGEGGFGVVYLAEQTETVKRQVTLKVITPGMDTQDSVRPPALLLDLY